MVNYSASRRRKKKGDDDVPVWARVPYRDIERIERALPPYGWRSRLVRTVVQRVSEHLSPGEKPSMERLMHLVEGAVDELFTPNDE